MMFILIVFCITLLCVGAKLNGQGKLENKNHARFFPFFLSLSPTLFFSLV